MVVMRVQGAVSTFIVRTSPAPVKAGGYFPTGLDARTDRAAAEEAASQLGTWPAGGSFTTRADRMPGHDSTASRASRDGS
jgi:hypothetical protein